MPRQEMSNEIQNPNAKKILIIHYRFLALSPKTIKKRNVKNSDQ